MKKIVFLGIVAMFSSIVISQNSIGLGKFKLYSPISLINELAYNEEYQDFTNEVYAIFQDSISGEETTQKITEPIKSVRSNEIRKFYIPREEIIPSLEISDVYLVFYGNKLISIQFLNYGSFCDAVSSKYGKPTTESKKGKSHTHKVKGKISVYYDNIYIKNWDVKVDRVTCKNTTIVFGDRNSIDKSESKFILCDNSINLINKDILDKKKKKAELEKIHKYDNL